MPFSSKKSYEAYYQAHREKILGQAKKYQREHPKKGRYPRIDKFTMMEKRHLIKLKVLSYYSNPQGTPVCNNCGEQDIDVLCLDHIEGGGRKQRRALTTTLYNWVLQNTFPIGFQVLCANCNMKKARLEYKGGNSKLSTVELSTN